MILLWLRCFTVQSIGKALLWIVLLGGAGYAAFYSVQCDKGETCVKEWKSK